MSTSAYSHDPRALVKWSRGPHFSPDRTRRPEHGTCTESPWSRRCKQGGARATDGVRRPHRASIAARTRRMCPANPSPRRPRERNLARSLRSRSVDDHSRRFVVGASAAGVAAAESARRAGLRAQSRSSRTSRTPLHPPRPIQAIPLRDRGCGVGASSVFRRRHRMPCKPRRCRAGHRPETPFEVSSATWGRLRFLCSGRRFALTEVHPTSDLLFLPRRRA
jgi:hypothetical protein